MTFGLISLILHSAITVGFTVRILYRKLTVSTTLAWIILIAALPYAGLAVYLLFGDHRLGRRRLKHGEKIRRYYQINYGVRNRAIENETIPSSRFYKSLSTLVANDTGFYPCGSNQIELMRDSEIIFDRMIADIEAAKVSVHLEFYIIHADGRVNAVLEAILAAAKRGVQVRILADAIGSRPFFRTDWPRKLRAAGADVLSSLEVGLIKSISKRTDLRNHRKLAVIDQVWGYLGSFNLIDPSCFKQSEGLGEWIDIMLRVEGDIVSSLACVFNCDFIFDSVGSDYTVEELQELKKENEDDKYRRDAVLQLVPSGPEMKTSIIRETIVAAIFGAKKRVVICTPYFVPDETVVLTLRNAARRGVEVILILPEKIDSRMAKHAGEANFTLLMQAGVKIYHYTGGLLHTKAIVVDGEAALIGTVNIDTRSFYLNLELSLLVFDEKFLKEFRALIENYLSNSELLDADEWRERGIIKRLKENIVRLASPVL